MNCLLSVLLLTCSFNLSYANNSFAATSIQLYCPSDLWLPCGADTWNLEQYGNAYYTHNGYQIDAGQAQVQYDLTSCQTGKIIRTWTIEDENWNPISCSQTIHIEGGNFNSSLIEWPEDIEIVSCSNNLKPDQLPEGSNRPTYQYTSCSMVGVSYKDQVFDFGPDCRKILRTWTLLDWCNYYPGSGNQGRWSYIQTIKLVGDSEAQLFCPPDVEVQAETCDGSYVDMLKAITTDQPCRGDYEITHNSIYADSLDSDDASGIYPVGMTTIEYALEYGCGKRTKCNTVIKVQEKAPVPYCLAELTTALMPIDTDGDGLIDDGMVELWAEDLNFNSYHPCYPNIDLRYSFAENQDSTSRVFTCANVGLNSLQLWVTDPFGNQTWCAVTVDVQNNAANIPDCEPVDNTRIHGYVKDYWGEALEQVTVKIDAKAAIHTETKYDTTITQVVADSIETASGMWLYFYTNKEIIETYQDTTIIPAESFETMTDSMGWFEMLELDANRSYIINAYKDVQMELIDAEDLAILKNYLTGNYEFKNINSFIAADVNEDKLIDIGDLYILQDLYLRKQQEWPEQRQWLFYDNNTLVDFDIELSVLDSVAPGIELEPEKPRFNTQDILAIAKGDLSSYETNFSDTPLENRTDIYLDASVYPNPFNNEFNVLLSANETVLLQVFDINGKNCLQSQLSEGNNRINTETLGPGTYFYRLNSNGKFSTGRIIKMD